jgi:hypothetical protein
VLCEANTNESEEEERRKAHDLIRAQVLLSKKVKLFHKYSKSMVLEQLLNID